MSLPYTPQIRIKNEWTFYQQLTPFINLLECNRNHYAVNFYKSITFYTYQCAVYGIWSPPSCFWFGNRYLYDKPHVWWYISNVTAWCAIPSQQNCSMIFAYASVPNKHQTSRKHHADATVTIIVSMNHVTQHLKYHITMTEQICSVKGGTLTNQWILYCAWVTLFSHSERHDVITWKRFPCYWLVMSGIVGHHWIPLTADSPHKQTLMQSFDVFFIVSVTKLMIWGPMMLIAIKALCASVSVHLTFSSGITKYPSRSGEPHSEPEWALRGCIRRRRFWTKLLLWRWHIIPSPVEAGQGINSETCGWTMCLTLMALVLVHRLNSLLYAYYVLLMHSRWLK